MKDSRKKANFHSNGGQPGRFMKLLKKNLKEPKGKSYDSDSDSESSDDE